MKKNDKKKFPKLATKDLLLTLLVLVLAFVIGFFGGYSCSSCSGVVTANADSPYFVPPTSYDLGCGSSSVAYSISADEVALPVYNAISSLTYFNKAETTLYAYGSNFYAPSSYVVGLACFEFPSVVSNVSRNSKSWLDNSLARVINYSSALASSPVTFRGISQFTLFPSFANGDAVNLYQLNLYSLFNNFCFGYYLPQGSSSVSEYYCHWYLLTENFNTNATVCVYYGVPLDVSLIYSPLQPSPSATSWGYDYHISFTWRLYYADTVNDIDYGNVSYFDAIYVPFFSHSYTFATFPSFNLSRMSSYLDISNSYGSGYSNGYTAGHSVGYTSGYNKGRDVALEDVTPLGWVSSSVNSLLKTEIIPGVSFSLLISIAFGILMLSFILKWFLGG